MAQALPLLRSTVRSQVSDRYKRLLTRSATEIPTDAFFLGYDSANGLARVSVLGGEMLAKYLSSSGLREGTAVSISRLSNVLAYIDQVPTV
ncbi:MAG: hypothetical protein WCD18_08040 [Thermosynechococcaceae cyanobacterium]